MPIYYPPKKLTLFKGVISVNYSSTDTWYVLGPAIQIPFDGVISISYLTDISALSPGNELTYTITRNGTQLWTTGADDIVLQHTASTGGNWADLGFVNGIGTVMFNVQAGDIIQFYTACGNTATYIIYFNVILS